MTNRKTKVALLSVASNTVLIILKVIAGIISGSVSIISEAIHSGMDLLASIIALFSVRNSGKPADEDHPYGHGKIENVSGVTEGILIFIAAALIITEAIKKIINPHEVTETTIAIVVMLISAVTNIVVSKILYKVAKEEDSIALEADALHLKTDVYTSAGVALGLLLIKFTGISMLDPIVAILVALLIIKEAWHLCTSAFEPLMDKSLSAEDIEKIKKIIGDHKAEFIDYHSLRTRKAGNIRHLDFHLVVKSDLSVQESHDITERIEQDLEKNIGNTVTKIHIEPA
ncbi:MAG: cation diffusion facilitator family transporter [Candidatus Gracilibacteria bacterium]|nr:cation diffusion facilitator family transporter [Candidatus Gracilibacteria bacterium]MDD3120256.1 cation diffusion facilitator family transporter [Candidatus Gracilibacteria bacterium]MDD4530007.1 cation diffusion facilitator family transporter [Candidatus Gracilibacteria bacterium]